MRGIIALFLRRFICILQSMLALIRVPFRIQSFRISRVLETYTPGHSNWIYLPCSNLQGLLVSQYLACLGFLARYV